MNARKTISFLYACVGWQAICLGLNALNEERYQAFFTIIGIVQILLGILAIMHSGARLIAGRRGRRVVQGKKYRQ